MLNKIRDRENYYIEYQTARINANTKIVFYHTDCGHYFATLHTYNPKYNNYRRTTEYYRIKKRDISKLTIELQTHVTDITNDYLDILRKYEKRKKNS